MQTKIVLPAMVCLLLLSCAVSCKKPAAQNNDQEPQNNEEPVVVDPVPENPDTPNKPDEDVDDPFSSTVFDKSFQIRNRTI